jgi:hypothetical protein
MDRVEVAIELDGRPGLSRGVSDGDRRGGGIAPLWAFHRETVSRQDFRQAVQSRFRLSRSTGKRTEIHGVPNEAIAGDQRAEMFEL